MKKTVAILITMALSLTFILSGCSSVTTSEASTTTQVSTSVQEESTSSVVTADSSATDTSKTAFNPDTETDTIAYADLASKYGPIPTENLPANTAIGGILKNLANEFWLMLGDGMTKEGDANGVKVDLQASRTETDVAGQLSIAETMLQNNYNAIILSPLTNDNLDSAVQKAIAAGIPVVNSNCEYIADCNTFVGGLQIEIGQKAADYIANKIGSSGKVAIIEGVSGTFTSIQRVKGFKETMAEKYSNIEIVASVPADYEMEKGMNVATDIITQNPDIKAIYCCNDNMALGAVEALRAANMLGKVVVLGVDGTTGAYDSITKGELNATVDQFAVDSGKAAVEVALRLIAGQKLPKVVSTPIEVIDISNMTQFGK